MLGSGSGQQEKAWLVFCFKRTSTKVQKVQNGTGFFANISYILNATQNQHFTHDPHGQQTQKIAIKSDFRVSTKFCTKYCVVCGILNENTPVSALILWTLAVCITVCCSAHAYTSITVTVAATVTA